MAFRRSWFRAKVTSSDGYSVEILDRTTILYQDATSRIFVSAEMLAPKNAWALYPSDMRIGFARGQQLQDEKLRAEIADRIKSVFDFLGWRLEVSS